MKKASKIFIIISIVLAVIGILVGCFIVYKSLMPSNLLKFDVVDLFIGIATIVACLVPLIIGFKSLSLLEDAQKRDDLIVIGIITLIFCSFLGGLFMLLMQDSDFN